jgi:hypothetical protein
VQGSSLKQNGDVLFSRLQVETSGLFVSLVYCAESTVRWFVVREKHCWMTADSADKSKRTDVEEVVWSVVRCWEIQGALLSLYNIIF